MILGFAGHQDLQDGARWVSDQIDIQIAQRHVTWGVTALAVGADQLFAKVLRGRGIPYTVVIPSARYEETFRSAEALAEYRVSLAAARKVEALSHPTPSERAFFAAGMAIVDKSDLLLAVWDGQPARGLGGTADVVSYALKLGHIVVQIDPILRNAQELFPSDVSL
jgi:hypothetical protein